MENKENQENQEQLTPEQKKAQEEREKRVQVDIQKNLITTETPWGKWTFSCPSLAQQLQISKREALHSNGLPLDGMGNSLAHIFAVCDVVGKAPEDFPGWDNVYEWGPAMTLYEDYLYGVGRFREGRNRTNN